LLALSCVVVLVSAEDGERPDFSKMRIKELRKILDDRGVKCEGCSEKFHMVERVQEVWDQPVISKPEEASSPPADTPSPPADAPSDDGSNAKAPTESTEELLSRLKGMPGMENLKMFTANDLKNGKFPGGGGGYGDYGEPPKKTRAEHRKELIDFYVRFGLQYEEDKIEKALDKFKGKEQKMFRSLYKKYDAEIKAFWAKEADKAKEGTEQPEIKKDKKKEKKPDEDKPLAEEELR